MDYRSWIMDHGQETLSMDHGSRITDHGSLIMDLPYDRILDNGITYNDIIYHSAVVPMAPREDTIR